DRHRLDEADGMPHECECDPNLGGAEEHRREMHYKRLRQSAMVAPNLLQPRAEIDDVSECGPLPSFAEGHQPFHQGFEGAEIQCEKKSHCGRYCDCQQADCGRADLLLTDKVEHDAKARQDETE